MAKNPPDIVKANPLIDAVFFNPPTLCQMRLMIAVLVQIKAKDQIIKPTDEFTVTAGQMVDLFDAAAKTNYKALATAADDLMETVVGIDHRPNGDVRPVVKRKMNIVTRCDYYKREGCVKLQFTDAFIPYISSLKSHFTKIETRYLKNIKSSYGLRLYDLCLEKNFSERWEIKVDELKAKFGIMGKYKVFGNFKARVLMPALEDINTFTDLNVMFEQRKAGRTITHLIFQIKKNLT